VVIKLFQRRSLPSDLRPVLEHGERVLGWARSADGAVIATNRGLWLDAQRLGWHEISKAVWDGRALIVTVAEIVEERPDVRVMRDLPARRVVLEDPDDVPAIVRERVTASIVSSELQEDGSRLVQRRIPGIDGTTPMLHLATGL